MRVYREGLAASLRQAALPYGYSVCIWASGAALIHRHGNPQYGDVFLFATGAMLAYGLLRLFGRAPSEQEQEQLGASPRTLRAGVIHVAALAAGIGTAALFSLIGGWPAWLLGAFGATIVYLGAAAVEAALLKAADPA